MNIKYTVRPGRPVSKRGAPAAGLPDVIRAAADLSLKGEGPQTICGFTKYAQANAMAKKVAAYAIEHGFTPEKGEEIGVHKESGEFSPGVGEFELWFELYRAPEIDAEDAEDDTDEMDEEEPAPAPARVRKPVKKTGATPATVAQRAGTRRQRVA